jgi:hypothetical protein
MEQQVGLRGFLEGGCESLDELVRQIAHEADRIGDHDLGTRCEPQTPRERIERRKELVGGEGSGTGEPVEQRRLAGVGVTDERDCECRSTIARATPRAALALDLDQLGTQTTHALAEHPAVEFDLLLARAPAHTNPPALPLQVTPAAHDAGLKMLEPRELDLQLALVAARTTGEDVEDEFGAVHDRHFPVPVQVALLDRRDFVIEEHETDLIIGQHLPDLIGLAGTDAHARIGARSTDDYTALRTQPRRAGECIEFVERRLVAQPAAEGNANQQAADGIGVGIRVQLSCASCWKLTGRPGTTVEIACL